jgi:adenylate kinase family enzyme
MRRILIVGNSGGGKSTLARRLGETPAFLASARP